MPRPSQTDYASLPALERDILLLRLGRRLSTQEVATKLNRPPAEIRRIQARALRRLHDGQASRHHWTPLRREVSGT